MPLYLVRVHDAPRNVTVTVAHDVSEYEVEATSLAEACELVFYKPVRVAPPVERKAGQKPGHRDYVEPDRSRFHAVADFTAGSRASLAGALERAAAEVAARSERATHIGGHFAFLTDRGTIIDCVTCDDSWDDPSADHAALLRHYVEKVWADEEVPGRSWFHDMHRALAKAGVDGPAERALAEEAYWDTARGVVAQTRAAPPEPPAPRMG